MNFSYRTPFAGLPVRATLSLACILCALWLSSSYWCYGPQIADGGVALGIACAAAVLMLTGIVAARLPPVARFFETGPGSVFAMVALATALVLVAVLTDSVGLWLVASVVYWTMLGLVLFLCIAGLVGLETRRCILSCSVASAVSSLIHGFVGIVDEGDEAIVLLCLAAVLSLAACLLCHREAVGTLRVASDSSDAPADLMYTQPSSFLPLWHGLYLLLLLFGFVAGMSLNFGGSGLGDNATPLSAVPIGVIAVYLLCSRRSVKFDFLHFVAVALAAAAFLSVGFINQRPLVVTAGLFGSAEGCFWAFIPALLIVLARRNDRNVVVVLGWGLGMFLLGWGVIPWAFNCLAHALPDEVPLMMFPLAWLFIVFNMWALRRMSLDAVIQSIVPAQDIIVHASQGDELLDDRIERLALLHKLTPRETEVFEQLARGRNAHYLQEYLGLTRNTIKTHISHIYTKLGVHGQQELIDLVTGTRA